MGSQTPPLTLSAIQSRGFGISMNWGNRAFDGPEQKGKNNAQKASKLLALLHPTWGVYITPSPVPQLVGRGHAAPT